MERKLVRNKTEFIQLCKHWREEEGYKNIQEDNIAHPSEYPCMVMIEEQLSKDGSDWCNFHYVYRSDFNEEINDTVRLDKDFFDCNIDVYKAIEVARHNENVFDDLVHWAVEFDNETDFSKLTIWKKIQRYFGNIWWAIIAPELIPARNIKIRLYSKLIELNKKVKSV